MALHLVTGYAGKTHITAADHGALNAGIFGNKDYVLNTGNTFSAVPLTANTIKILDGEMILHGRQIRMEAGDYEEVTVENGTTDQKRNDLICIRYTKNAETGIESVSCVTIKGAPDASSPVDPSYNTGSILDGTLIVDFPLYRVPLDGLNVGELVPLFETKDSLADRMEEAEGSVEALKKGTTPAGKAKDADTLDGKHASDFLSSKGGTVNGELIMGNNRVVTRHLDGYSPDGVNDLHLNYSNKNSQIYAHSGGTSGAILHSGNVGIYALPIYGGTVNGSVKSTSGLYAVRNINNETHEALLAVAGNGRAGLYHRTNNVNDAILYVSPTELSYQPTVNGATKNYGIHHDGNSNKIVFTEDDTTAPTDTTALWAHL